MKKQSTQRGSFQKEVYPTNIDFCILFCLVIEVKACVWRMPLPLRLFRLFRSKYCAAQITKAQQMSRMSQNKWVNSE